MLAIFIYLFFLLISLIRHFLLLSLSGLDSSMLESPQ